MKQKLRIIVIVLFVSHITQLAANEKKIESVLRTANLVELAAKPLLRTLAVHNDSVLELATPSVGNQEQSNTCAAWSLGYANASIILYDTLHNWEDALRSPVYIYNNRDKELLIRIK